jgi:hypothetical protein
VATTQQTAWLEALLEGVSLPADKQELVEYARGQQDGAEGVRLLEQLPEREYESLDDVGEALAPVQPSADVVEAPLARDESGEPPGGEAYVDPGAEPGAVRDDAPRDYPAEKQIEKASELLKQQQEQREKS